jgi:hypothetical protein
MEKGKMIFPVYRYVVCFILLSKAQASAEIKEITHNIYRKNAQQDLKGSGATMLDTYGR